MPALLLSHACDEMFGAELAAALKRIELPLELLPLPAEPDARLGEADIARIEVAFFTQDLFPHH